MGPAGGSTPSLRVLLRDVIQQPHGGQAVRLDFSSSPNRLFRGGVPHPEMNYDRSASELSDLADFAIFSAELSSGAVAAYCP